MFGLFKNPSDRAAADVHVAHAEGSVVIVDVREANEFAVERISGAVNMPLSRFDPHGLSAAGEPAKVVLQCQSGMRSMTALKRCRAAGVEVYGHLAGGIGSWKAAGLPTVRGIGRGGAR